ncbi:MAG: aminotransferase class V-fold PLP-dependent enzyme [Fuerstiella sp.]
MNMNAQDLDRQDGGLPGNSPSENALPKFEWPLIDDETTATLQQMAGDGSWGRYHGSHCPALLEALKEFHQVDHAYLCSSGTSAIELALRSALVGPGDEVVLCAYDYKANFANVLALQATPVLVDVASGALAPNLSQIEQAITDKTKAIIVSHLHGWLVDVKSICELAHSLGIIVIEDACQVTGATVTETTVTGATVTETTVTGATANRQIAGTVGDVGTLSFGGSKLLTAGRGGCVVTSNPTLAQRIRLYDHRGNEAYPLSEMQAAVLKPQLAKLDQLNRQRANSVCWLCDNWPEDSVIQPVLSSSYMQSAFFKVPFQIRCASTDRKRLLNRLQQRGVPLAEAFPALHRIHSKRRFRMVAPKLPEADRLHDALLTLHHPILLQPAEVIARLRDELIAASGESRA